MLQAFEFLEKLEWVDESTVYRSETILLSDLNSYKICLIKICVAKQC